MTKIWIKDAKGEETPFEVKKLNLMQFSKTIKIVTDVFKLASENDAIAQLIDNVMFTQQGDEEAADDLFKTQSLEALTTLLSEAPDKGFELLSVLSGVKSDLLMEQDIEVAFDVFDAIIETNDVEALINRAKKSFAATKQKAAFMKKVETVTA